MIAASPPPDYHLTKRGAQVQVVMQAINIAFAWSMEDDARSEVSNDISCPASSRLQRNCVADVKANDNSSCRLKWKVRAHMRDGRVVVVPKLTENTCTAAWA